MDGILLDPLQVKDSTGVTVNPATADLQSTLQELVEAIKVMLHLIKPLGIISGAGSGRLQTDIYNITTGTLATVSTVSSVTSVGVIANQTNIGGVNAFQQMKDLSTAGFQSIRNNIT